jgi:hypothetical protein
VAAALTPQRPAPCGAATHGESASVVLDQNSMTMDHRRTFAAGARKRCHRGAGRSRGAPGCGEEGQRVIIQEGRRLSRVHFSNNSQVVGQRNRRERWPREFRPGGTGGRVARRCRGPRVAAPRCSGRRTAAGSGTFPPRRPAGLRRDLRPRDHIRAGKCNGPDRPDAGDPRVSGRPPVTPHRQRRCQTSKSRSWSPTRCHGSLSPLAEAPDPSSQH